MKESRKKEKVRPEEKTGMQLQLETTYSTGGCGKRCRIFFFICCLPLGKRLTASLPSSVEEWLGKSYGMRRRGEEKKIF